MSSLDQKLTLTASSRYLKQCWLVTNWAHRNTFKWHSKQSLMIFIHVVRKMQPYYSCFNKTNFSEAGARQGTFPLAVAYRLSTVGNSIYALKHPRQALAFGLWKMNLTFPFWNHLLSSLIPGKRLLKVVKYTHAYFTPLTIDCQVNCTNFGIITLYGFVYFDHNWFN